MKAQFVSTPFLVTDHLYTAALAVCIIKTIWITNYFLRKDFAFTKLVLCSIAVRVRLFLFTADSD